MSEEKQKTPAFVKFEATGELEPIEYNWIYMIHVCRETVTAGKKFVILPVEVPQTYKKQRYRLVGDDKESPRGLILRDQESSQRYYPYAPARFDVEELAAYAAARFNDMTETEIDEMVQRSMQ